MLQTSRLHTGAMLMTTDLAHGDGIFEVGIQHLAEDGPRGKLLQPVATEPHMSDLLCEQHAVPSTTRIQLVSLICHS